MEQTIHTLTLLAVLAPLVGSIIVGLLCMRIPKIIAHSITISGVAISFLCSCYIFDMIVLQGYPAVNFIAYDWVTSGSFNLDMGFLVDQLTSVMFLVVTFVSLLVHIYSVGYMAEDSGYARFFSYMSLFTFSMLLLVGANNLIQLFFGWEGVGLVSYLLIGFWYQKDSAANGSFKAFLVNRVGDFAFLLGMAAILDYFGTINYAQIFAQAPTMAATTINIFPHSPWLVVTVICILLFIGAMGKSAQIPLHVWLPESMEGPTPISALIHAATMVTAGVFMIARMSPLFELSDVALSLVLVIGATTALFTGLIAIVQTDIKRIIAYSTMSQLGYMVAANGASAFSAGIFHLLTHACFKALLFLAAGSVIIAMHHEQDIFKMGNLKKYIPTTYVTFLIGALALTAIPPFAGFYSKDAIIEAVSLSTIPGATYSYFCLLLGAFVTGVYTFRLIFVVFHGEEKMSNSLRQVLHESPKTVRFPLIILAIPSVIIGAVLAKPMVYTMMGLLGNSVYVASSHDVAAELAADFPGTFAIIFSGFLHAPFWFAAAGIFVSWYCYVKHPSLPVQVVEKASWAYKACVNKLGFDAFNNIIFVHGLKKFSDFLYYVTDVKWIDGWVVAGSGNGIVRISNLAKKLQSGYLYHYAFAMILGLFGLLIWLLVF